MITEFLSNDKEDILNLLESITRGADPMKMIQNAFNTTQDLLKYANSLGITITHQTLSRALYSNGTRHFAERIIAFKILLIKQLPPSSEQYLILLLNIAIDIRDHNFKRQVFNTPDDRGVYRSQGFTKMLAKESGSSLISVQAIMAILRVELVIQLNVDADLKESFMKTAENYIKRYRIANTSERHYVANILEEFLKNDDIVGFYKYVTQDKKALHSWYMEELDLLDQLRDKNNGKLTAFIEAFLKVILRSGERNAIGSFRAQCVELTGVSVKHQRALNAMQNLLMYGNSEVTFWNNTES